MNMNICTGVEFPVIPGYCLRVVGRRKESALPLSVYSGVLPPSESNVLFLRLRLLNDEVVHFGCYSNIVMISGDVYVVMRSDGIFLW